MKLTWRWTIMRIMMVMIAGALTLVVPAGVVQADEVATYPLEDGFEAEEPAACWTVSGTYSGDQNWGFPDENYTGGTHSGDRCLTSSPTGSYGNNEERILLTVVDFTYSPSEPVLSFWQRYNLGVGDYICVEISQDQGSTWSRLYGVTGMKLGWHQVRISLASYRNEEDLQVRFKLKSDSADCQDGWYIDDVKIAEGTTDPALPVPFLDGAETGSSEDLWNSSSWVRSDDDAYDGDNCWYIVNNDPYKGYYYLTSARNFDLFGTTSPELVYMQKADQYDRLYVQVSTNNGLTWKTLNYEDVGEWPPSSWSRKVVDLSDYTDQKIRLRFYLNKDSAGWWMLDNISIADAEAGVVLEEPVLNGYNGLDLSWSRYTGDDFLRYEIRRSTSSGVTFNSYLVNTINDIETLNYTDTGLAMNRDYYYKIYVVKTGGVVSSAGNEVQGQTASWPYPLIDDFESGELQPWWSYVNGDFSDGRTWGLCSSYTNGSGYCVTSSPGGSYTSYDERILQAAVSLSDAASPVLSFDHYYHVGSGTCISVEISTDGSNWEKRYARYDSGSNDMWTRERVDLSSYQGKDVVFLRFRLKSYQGSGGEGWYIDDVQIEDGVLEPVVNLPFMDDAETAYSEEIWNSSAWYLSYGDSSSGEKSWFVNSNNISDGTYYLTSAKKIDLRDVENPILGFWEKYYTRDSRFRVELSLNDGLSWKTIRYYRDTREGVTTSWQWMQVDLSPYRGQKIRLRFSMDCNRDGWWRLDDITIAEQTGGVELQAPVPLSHTSLQLNWSRSNLSPEEFLRYEIRRSKEPGVDVVSTLVYTEYDSAITSYVDSNLDQNQVYYYKVYEVGRENIFAGSNEVMSTTSYPYYTSYPVYDNFEGDSVDADWSLTTWGIAEGKGRNGGKCLTDSPDTVYGNNENRILTTAVDLRLAQMPVLTFWHRHNLATGDLGYVTISTDQGANWTRLFVTGGVIDGWKEENIDLSFYAGQSDIWLAFHLDTDSDVVTDGWYIDDVSIAETATPVLDYPFVADAEDPSGLVKIFDSGWQETVDAAYSGKKGWYVDYRDPYKGMYYLTASGSIDLNDAINPVLTFWHSYYLSYSKVIVQGSIDGGIEWENIYYWETGYNSKGDWARTQISLSDYRGEKLRLRFITYDGSGWWKIDNISVSEADSIEPDSVNDLRVKFAGNRSITLKWTAVGDDEKSGQAYIYDIRYSTETIEESNFEEATQVISVVQPQTAGMTESITINNLYPATAYYFAVKAADELLQWSGISNIATGTTTHEISPGAAAVEARFRTDPAGQLGEFLQEMVGGHDYTYTIYIDASQVQQLHAASYNITYDPEILEVTGVTDGLIGEVNLPVDNWNIIEPGEAGQPNRVSIVQEVEADGSASGDGYLAVLQVRPVAGNRLDTSIGFEDGELTRLEDGGEEITAEWYGCSFIRTDYYSGDANGDNAVNAIDLVKAKRFVVELDMDDPQKGADANHDGDISAMDVTRVRYIIMEAI